MGTNLISIASDKYIRRLVKEIRNSFEHGVYVELPDGSNRRIQAFNSPRAYFFARLMVNGLK